MFFSLLRPSPLVARASSLVSRSFAVNEATVEFDNPYKTFLCDPPPSSIQTTRDEILGMYRLMYRMRRLETAADTLYKGKLIRGFCHLYSGQEAVAVGMEAAIKREDHLITAYRAHCTSLGRGVSAQQVLSELLGRVDGCSRGKGGSMHMYSIKGHFYGGNGIVGAQVPVGTGIAMAQKYQNTGNICVAMYGDGAANQGQIYEAFNMAALWKLPVVYVLENNHYGMGTSIERAAASPDYYKRGGYFPGIKADGMSVLNVKAAMKYAADWARSGNGPILVEFDTYRYSGHSMSDPGTTYRTREEVAKIRESKDPILNCKAKILKYDLGTEDELKQIEKEVKTEIDEAVNFAKNSPEPPMSELFEHVYTEPIPLRGVEITGSFVPK